MWILVGVTLVVLAVLVYDLVQREHAILRNFPFIGHFRYMFEAVGPELRQYIVTSNNEEKPFSRDERRWVYASAKKQNNYFGFGTDHDTAEIDVVANGGTVEQAVSGLVVIVVAIIVLTSEEADSESHRVYFDLF